MEPHGEPENVPRPRPQAQADGADSIILRARLGAGGPYLALFATSVLRRLIADHYVIAALRVDLRPNDAFSTRIVTPKNRTLSPAVERLREVAASFAGKQAGRTARSSKSRVS
jgi:hypothetical protein